MPNKAIFFFHNSDFKSQNHFRCLEHIEQLGKILTFCFDFPTHFDFCGKLICPSKYQMTLCVNVI